MKIIFNETFSELSSWNSAIIVSIKDFESFLNTESFMTEKHMSEGLNFIELSNQVLEESQEPIVFNILCFLFL